MLASEHGVDVFFVLLHDCLPVDLHRTGDQTLLCVSTRPIAYDTRSLRSVESTPLSPALDHQ